MTTGCDDQGKASESASTASWRQTYASGCGNSRPTRSDNSVLYDYFKDNLHSDYYQKLLNKN